MATDGAWTRYGRVASWQSVDPARHRDRCYALRWQPGLFGPCLLAEWGAAGAPAARQRAWWPADTKEAGRTERRVLQRRAAHGYTCVARGPAWPPEVPGRPAPGVARGAWQRNRGGGDRGVGSAKSAGGAPEAGDPSKTLETLDTGRRVYVLCGDGRVLYATRSLNGELGDFSTYARTNVEDGRRLLADKRAAAKGQI